MRGGGGERMSEKESGGEVIFNCSQVSYVAILRILHNLQKSFSQFARASPHWYPPSSELAFSRGGGRWAGLKKSVGHGTRVKIFTPHGLMDRVLPKSVIKMESWMAVGGEIVVDGGNRGPYVNSVVYTFPSLVQLTLRRETTVSKSGSDRHSAEEFAEFCLSFLSPLPSCERVTNKAAL